MALDLNKVALCYPNYTDLGTLSGGTYTAGLPLNNAKNRIFAKKARTTNLTAANTLFNLALARVRPVGCVAIAAHNFSATSTVRIRVYAEIAQTTLLYDSGVISVWPAVYDSSSELEWEYNNFWEGTLDETDRAAFTPLFTHIFEIQIAESIKVEIFDSTNTAGYVEFGRIFVSDVFQPAINMIYGVEFGYENATEIESALDTTEYFDRKRQKRTATFQFDALSESEAFQKIYNMRRDLGIDGEILYAYNLQSGSPSFQARTFLGRNVTVNGLSQPYIDRFDSAISLLEII